jgi:DNA-binding MarR family transcriptional regulator
MSLVLATLACMQGTAVSPPAPATEVAHDVFAVMAYLLRASSHDVFSAVGELELSLTQIKLLHFLDEEECVGLKELGDRIALSLPAASRAIDGLHQRGLVERRENEADRRMKSVQITPAGADAVRRLNEARLSFLEQFAASLTDTQRRRLSSALAPIVARDEVAACRPQGHLPHD